MRSVTVVPVALILAACIHADELRTNRAAAAQAPEQPARIPVSEQSNVCVTVHIDQRIWPLPLAPDSGQIFSGSLMTELRNLYERRGGSTSLPGRGRPDRFVTNEHDDDVDCQDRDTDVFVVAHYRPRADGTAFVFDYRISRGAMTRAGRIEVDVTTEIRAGRIRGFTQRRTMVQVIYEDLLSRAPMILDQLTIQRP